MKELSFEKMEKIVGGGWGCFWAIAGLASIATAAVLAPPAGAALAATIAASGLGFGGFIYGLYAGACG